MHPYLQNDWSSWLTTAVDAYVARPGSSTECGIILFPDFMGYELVNAKLYGLSLYPCNVGTA